MLGERIDLQVLAEVTGGTPAEAGTVLDQAVARGVLASAHDVAGLSFAHALVRDAVYDDLGPARRMALHERAARALERSERAAACAGQIAGHWQRSGGPGQAAHCARWAREAARSATALLAYDEAARFAVLALHATEADGAQPEGLRAELALDAARAEFVAGHVEASLEHCQAAARLAEDAGRPDIVAAAALVITGMGDPATTAAVDTLCARALGAVPAESTALRARLRARQAIFAAETGAGNRARDLSAEALALAEHSGDPDALLDAMHARHLSLSAPQFLAERRELAARACQVAHRARQPLAVWGHVWLVDAAFQDGDLAAVDRELARIEEFAAYGRRSLASWHLHRLRATRAALVGELDAAVAHNEAARAVAAQIGAFSTSGMYYAFLDQLALLRGTIDRELAETTLGMLRQVPGIPLVRVFVPLTYALLGERDLARATFEEFRHMPGAIEVGPRWAALITMIGTGALLLARIDSAARAANPLSPRESEVAELVGLAMSNRQIAERLVLSERTVETHVRSILAKLGYSTRTEIATWALRRATPQ